MQLWAEQCKSCSIKGKETERPKKKEERRKKKKKRRSFHDCLKPVLNFYWSHILVRCAEQSLRMFEFHFFEICSRFYSEMQEFVFWMFLCSKTKSSRRTFLHPTGRLVGKPLDGVVSIFWVLDKAKRCHFLGDTPPISIAIVWQKYALVLSHFWVIFDLGSLWGGTLEVTFESLLGHFKSFCVSVELGARPLHKVRGRWNTPNWMSLSWVHFFFLFFVSPWIFYSPSK